MDWNKAKNIIILLLAALNLFLLGNLAYKKLIGPDLSETQKELSSYLENRGIRLLCQIPEQPKQKRGLMIAENSEKLARTAVETLLGGNVESAGGEIIGKYGHVSFVAGVFEGVLTELPFGDTVQNAVEHLSSAGIKADRTEYGENSAVLYKTCTEEGLTVYNSRLSLSKEDDGWHISGKWFLGDPVPVSGETERGAAGLLVTFADTLQKQGTPVSEIRAVYAGYAASVLTNVGTKLTPAYRIETDAGIYYISALDASLLDI